MLAEVTNAIVRLHRRHFGKGPTKSKSYLLDDVLVCVMRDVYTTVERTLIESGRVDRVRETRQAFQEAMQVEFAQAVERVTGRKVVAVLSQSHADPDLAIDVFILEPEAGSGP